METPGLSRFSMEEQFFRLWNPAVVSENEKPGRGRRPEGQLQFGGVPFIEKLIEARLEIETELVRNTRHHNRLGMADVERDFNGNDPCARNSLRPVSNLYNHVSFASFEWYLEPYRFGPPSKTLRDVPLRPEIERLLNTRTKYGNLSIGHAEGLLKI